LSISQLNCLLFGVNDSWSLTPNSDNQLGKKLAGGWQKSRYKKCFEAFTKLKIELKLGPYFGIIFGFVEGATKNCEFKIYQLEDRVYCSGQVQPDTFLKEFSNSIGDLSALAECSRSTL
jgi:hypothetical protein